MSWIIETEDIDDLRFKQCKRFIFIMKLKTNHKVKQFKNVKFFFNMYRNSIHCYVSKTEMHFHFIWSFDH